ncbi:MAG: DNA topoisomerase I [Candidatus Altiarchaeota archaeon]
MTELIITEKPKVAERIARALGNPKRLGRDGVAYFQVEDILVAPAVGHLYGLVEKDKKGWTYPVFDIKWTPNYESSKSADYTKKYLENLKSLAKKADSFVNACDYDVEGEVIGFNALLHACGVDPYKDNVKRMKFSTLTPDAIKEAYKIRGKIDRGLVDAGLSRHTLDWYWGINLSRALTLAVRRAHGYTTLTIGRVQGPTLKFLSIREKQIMDFKSETYWQVELTASKQAELLVALFEDQKISGLEKAEKIKSSCGPTALVTKVERKTFSQEAPCPFDLTTLQTEAYKHLKIDPRKTLEVAQELYTSALISYPRTGSQELPVVLNLKEIVRRVSENPFYTDVCRVLISKEQLNPANGKKTDPAHPAIHPTGVRPANLGSAEEKIYDLIVRRFLATFGEPAKRETVKVELDCKGNRFLAEGTTTVEKGWHTLYGPYAKFKELELPHLIEGDILEVKKVEVVEKETQPPKRYSPASIIKEMERYNIGTKATRSQILDILFKRGYVTGKSMEVTPLGLSVYETLSEHSPLVLDVQLTRRFENSMEEIELGKISAKEVITKGRETLTNILTDFKRDELKIGSALAKSVHTTQQQKNGSYLGDCHKCEDGNLTLRKSPYGGFFAGCSNYPECKYTITLPKGNLKRTGNCKVCSYAVLSTTGKSKFTFCINPECPSKKKA